MRILVGEFEKAFESIHEESLALIMASRFDPLGSDEKPSGKSVSELVVRGAARVEQCFGGIATRLWDDPYEWTLPESFSDKSAVLAYLGEVKITRIKGFELLGSDRDLTRKIAAPVDLKTVFEVILNALTDSNRHLALASDIANSSK